MNDGSLTLDGNAAAGILQEVFVGEATSARGACAACGTVDAMGSQHLYMAPHAPGAVLRCHGCGSILMVLVHRPGHIRLALQGLAWLEIAQPDTPA